MDGHENRQEQKADLRAGRECRTAGPAQGCRTLSLKRGRAEVGWAASVAVLGNG